MKMLVIWGLALVAALDIFPPSCLSGQEPLRISVDSVPILRLGTIDGEGPTAFFQVEDIVIHGDTLVVANRGSNEIRFFSLPEGRYLRSVGGFGEGPGEFQWLRFIEECHRGELTAFDPIALRITIFSFDGRLIETHRLPQLGERRVSDVRCGFDGGYLAEFQGWSRVDVGQSYRPMMSLVELPRDGSVEPRVVMEAMADERYRFPRSDGPRVFGKKTVFVAWQDQLVVGTGDAFQLKVVDRSGMESFTLSIHDAPVPVQPRHVHFVTERQVQAVESYGESVVAELRHNMETIDYPRTFPPYNHVEVDATGRIWIERYPIPEAGWRQTWEVFSSHADHLASVTFPVGFVPFWIGTTRVAGKRRITLGVEVVEVLSYSIGESR